jgi:hypothetical protein
VRSLTAEDLLPGPRDDIEPVPGQVHSEGRRGGVADDQALAVGRDPVGVRNAHAGCGAVPGEDDITVPGVDPREIGQLAVRGLEHAHFVEPELLRDVGDPFLAEALPGEHVDATRAEQRPQRHLHRPGVGAGHDGDAAVARNAEHRTGEVDGFFQLRLARLRAVGAPDYRIAQGGGRPARALGAGAGGEVGIARAARGCRDAQGCFLPVVSRLRSARTG